LKENEERRAQFHVFLSLMSSTSTWKNKEEYSHFIYEIATI